MGREGRRKSRMILIRVQLNNALSWGNGECRGELELFSELLLLALGFALHACKSFKNQDDTDSYIYHQMTPC